MYHECRHILTQRKEMPLPRSPEPGVLHYHNNLQRHSRPPANNNLTLHSEDNCGIRIALTRVLAPLKSPYVDTRCAGLMLYGLQLAALLANRTSDLEPDETVRTCHESTGAALGPEKTVCEPPRDCRSCPRQHTCEDYEDPDEDEPKEGGDDSDDEKEDECDRQASDCEDDEEDEEETDEKETA